MNRYVAGNIFGGSGKSFVCWLDKTNWKDFATGEEGSDVVALYAKQKSISMGEALGELEDRYAGRVAPKQARFNPMQKGDKTLRTLVAPLDTILPSRGVKDPETGNWVEPTKTWAYIKPGEGIYNWASRYDFSDGSKAVIPYVLRSRDDSSKPTIRQGAPPKRILYNLEKIKSHPEAKIFVVEGEKCADAIDEFFSRLGKGTSYVGTTWLGGAGYKDKLNDVDLSPLYGRDVYLVPDNDEAGRSAMRSMALLLRARARSLKVIDPEPSRPAGWDVADALEEEGFDFIAWAKSRVKEIAIKEEEPKPPSIIRSALPSTLPEEEDLTVHFKKNGNLVHSLENYVKLLRFRFKEMFYYDTMLCEHYTFMDTDEERGRKVEDRDYLTVQVELEKMYPMEEFRKRLVMDALDKFCLESPQNWADKKMSSYVWDGVPRIDTALHRVTGCPDNEFTRAVSANLFKAMRVRTMRPGEEFHHVVVLEGAFKQGQSKSRFCRAICLPGHFAEVHGNLGNKDEQFKMIGKQVVELVEGATHSKSDVETLKSIITMKSFNERKPYGRKSESHNFTHVFIMTTNESNYLRDKTGNRRFWPIECLHDEFKFNIILEEREQWWAEAEHRLKQGELWYEVPKEMAIEIQESRLEESLVTERVAAFIEEWPERAPKVGGNPKRFKLSDVMDWYLQYHEQEIKFTKGKIEHILGHTLRHLGCNPLLLYANNRRSRWWALPGLSRMDLADQEESDTSDKKKEIINFASAEMLARRGKDVTH